MLNRIRWALTRFFAKYGTDWDKDHADSMAAIERIRAKQPEPTPAKKG